MLPLLVQSDHLEKESGKQIWKKGEEAELRSLNSTKKFKRVVGQSLLVSLERRTTQCKSGR